MRKDEILPPVKEGEEGTFIAIPKILASIPTKLISSDAKIVYGVLLERLGKNKTAFPGLDSISADTGMNISRVKRATALLKKQGLILSFRTPLRNNHYKLEKVPITLIASLDHGRSNENPNPHRRNKAHIVQSLDHGRSNEESLVGPPADRRWTTGGPSLDHRRTVVGPPVVREQKKRTNSSNKLIEQTQRVRNGEGRVSPIEGEDGLDGHPVSEVNMVPTTSSLLIDSLRKAGYPLSDKDIKAIPLLISAWNSHHQYLNKEKIKLLSKRYRNHPFTIQEMFRPAGLDGHHPAWVEWLKSVPQEVKPVESNEATKLLISAWEDAGLNGIKDKELVIKSIGKQVNLLFNRLGKNAFVELIVKAIAYRASDFRLESSSAQSIEWLFRSTNQNGAQVFNIERLALGDFNWKDEIKNDNNRGIIKHGDDLSKTWGRWGKFVEGGIR